MGSKLLQSTPIHDRMQDSNHFAYFSYLLNPENRLSLVIGSVSAQYQIPDQDNADALWLIITNNKLL